ncbi:phospholipid/cholesterol/gamma-HCH transport system permease protein [Algoriphagus boseongensis]|uniref:Phospholipid/cholesterol/gamma-HCH transport system permease protein n=1 Tax=Algoriphagus boseongensis TaxID=1442587 RepID=A0A4V3D2G5_9BACT|nr:ABC transporter permease [Algoriphagus boseongensis]TDQ18827.1 phospholipid/cholesterol/gamma-HCH transport system permease protein [Algoriphagus boseongensis]
MGLERKIDQPFFKEVGEISRFTARFFREVTKPKQEWDEFINQCYWIGYKALTLVSITAFIMGLVLTIQSRPTLVEFGAAALLPSMVSVSLVREISPVITALICAGKIGSGIGAELGSMRVTEQIDAMEVSGTNPFKYLVVTRVLAATVMVPILSSLAIGISLYGGYLGTNIRGEVSWTLYVYQAYDALSYGDFLPSIIKTIFFGFAIGIVGCYKGYTSQKGTEGVGRSATTAVIVASLLVFILDLIAVQVVDILGLT